MATPKQSEIHIRSSVTDTQKATIRTIKNSFMVIPQDYLNNITAATKPRAKQSR